MSNFLVRALIALPALMFAVLWQWMMGLLLEPQLTLLRDQNVTWLSEIELVFKVGLQYSIPLLALVVVAWAVYGSIRTDSYSGYRRRP